MSEKRTEERTDKCGRKRFITVLLFAGLIMLLLFTGCMGKEETKNSEGKIEISSENPCWSPVMSSIIGIDITPHYTGYSGDVRYHCHASGGRFLLWNEPDYKVINFGKDAITRESTLWWSYTDIEENFQNSNYSRNATYIITIEAVSADSGIILAKGDYFIEKENLTYCLKNN